MQPLVAEINRTRTLGVEHEFYLPAIGNVSAMDVQRQVAAVLCANGIRAVARGYDHSVLPTDIDIAVETDGSIHGTTVWEGVQHIPIEIKTRILTYDEWEAIMPKTLQIIQYLGGRINSSCGYHIHLGMPEIRERPTVIRSIYNLFRRFEPVIIGGLVPPSRRDNGFSCPINRDPRLLHGCKTLQSFQRALRSWTRYMGLNLTHLFERNPHLEVRYAGSTLDPVKARHWLRFCLQMTEHACKRNCQATEEQVANDKKGMFRLLTTCGFRPNSGIYSKVSTELRETGRYLLLKRFRHFKKNESRNPAGGEDC